MGQKQDWNSVKSKRKCHIQFSSQDMGLCRRCWRFSKFLILLAGNLSDNHLDGDALPIKIWIDCQTAAFPIEKADALVKIFQSVTFRIGADCFVQAVIQFFHFLRCHTAAIILYGQQNPFLVQWSSMEGNIIVLIRGIKTVDEIVFNQWLE